MAAAAVVLFVATASYLYLRARQPRERKAEAPIVRAEAAPPPADVGAGEAPPPTPVAGPPPPESRPGYLVIGLSSRGREEAEAEAERRNREGHHAHVRLSDDWPNLAHGYYVVVYDTFDSLEEAGRAAGAFKARGIDAYAKYSGPAKSGEAAGEAAAPAAEAGGTEEKDPPPTAGPDEEAAVRRYDAVEREAVGEVEKLWDRHFTRCGDTYVAVDSNGVPRQLRGVTFVPRGVTFVLRAPGRPAAPVRRNEVEWSGKVQVGWKLWRKAARRGAEWVWEDWRERPQSRSFEVRKVNSEWRVLNALDDMRKVDCSEVPG